MAPSPLINIPFSIPTPKVLNESSAVAVLNESEGEALPPEEEENESTTGGPTPIGNEEEDVDGEEEG